MNTKTSNNKTSAFTIVELPTSPRLRRTSLVQSGFTIVELLVVIVVIGILAAITIVAYRGITGKATIASLESDLTNASKQLKLFQVENSAYPETIRCDIPDSSTNKCVKSSSGNDYTYPAPNNSSSPQTFTLDAANGTITYRITNDSTPTDVTTTPITAIAAISGTTTVGSALTAGALTPSGATVAYQWQSATTSGGSYTNIAGATASTYTLVAGDWSKYIKVVATATGSYSGTQTSAASAVVSDPANWLTIGTQTWAKYNLNVGTMITGVTEQADNSTLEKYCYDDNGSNCTTYGGLYQWDEAMQYVTTEGAQGICPAGSHIPSDNDIKILEMQLGMSQAQADAVGWRGTDQGTKLISGGSSGLNILLAGRRNGDGSFTLLSLYAVLWSSSESAAKAFERTMASDHATVDRNTIDEFNGYAVRCVGN